METKTRKRHAQKSFRGAVPVKIRPVYRGENGEGRRQTAVIVAPGPARGIRKGVTFPSVHASRSASSLHDPALTLQHFPHALAVVALDLDRRGSRNLTRRRWDLTPFGIRPPNLKPGQPGKLPGSRIVEGRFMGVQQSIAVPKGRDAGLAYLRRVVEDAKASGLVARAIEKTGARGVSVAPPAK